MPSVSMATRLRQREEEVLRILRSNNYFECLRVDFSSGEVDIETVKTQYKKLALLVHPDKCKHPQAGDAFKALTQAFDCLRDPVLQAEYRTKLAAAALSSRNSAESVAAHFAQKRKSQTPSSKAKTKRKPTENEEEAADTHPNKKTKKEYYSWTYSVPESKRKQNSKKQEPNVVHCTVCNRKFPNQDALEKHLRFADYNHRNMKKTDKTKPAPKLDIYDDL